MILQPEHEHQQTPSSSEKEDKPPTPPPKVIKPTAVASPPQSAPPAPPSQQPVPQGPKSPQILTTMLENSLKLIPQFAAPQIRQKMKYMQQKVHFSFSQGLNQYLKHLRGKRKPDTQSLVKQVIDIQTWLAVDKIWSGKSKLYERGQLSSMQGEISGKLHEMKKSMMGLSAIQKKAQSYVENLLEFRKKHYWQHQSQKSKQVKDFLTKMKRVQSDHKKHVKEQIKKQQRQVQKSLQIQKKHEEQLIKKIHAKQLQKQISWRKQRQKISQQDEKKRESIEAMLQKYKNEKPMHVKLQQQYIKNVLQPLEQQRQRKLQEIKKLHQPVELEQIQEHSQRYQEYKQKLLEEHRQKDDQFNDLNSQLQQNLKDLYHSKFHTGMEPRFYNSLKIGREEARRKSRQYSQTVLEKKKPKIDPAKRQKIKQTIRDLELREDKTKVKIVKEDGSVVIQEKPTFNGYRLGLNYLEQIREDNEGKPRKEDRSASMMELPVSSKVKRIDYLRQSKPKVVLQKKTIGEWKKVVGDNSFSPRQKYEFIMQQAAVMQQKSQMKQQQMRSYKKGDKAMQLKGEMDKYYAESVAAKMVVLKDVIMKQ